jgi:hypothetical protein
LKPEGWGSPLVQGKYQEEKVCDKRYPYRVMMMMMMMIIINLPAAPWPWDRLSF